MVRSFCLLALSALAFQAQAALIHQYTFDTNANDSVGSDNGTLLNGATVGGGVLSLDGSDDYVDFASSIVPTTGSRTISLFARQLSLQGNFRELISQGGSGSAFYLGHDTSHNIRVGDAWLSTGVAFPSDGLWHHYTVVYDFAGSQTRLYIDGSLEAWNSFFTAGGGGTPTRFGRQYNGHTEFFHGEIDNVRIYDSALTGAEVAALQGVPEPASFGVMAAGLLALHVTLKRRGRLPVDPGRPGSQS